MFKCQKVQAMARKFGLNSFSQSLLKNQLKKQKSHQSLSIICVFEYPLRNTFCFVSFFLTCLIHKFS
jgi:hypothetical protein